MNTKDLSKDLTIDNIDFKVLSKSCRTQDDLSSLTKHFMNNMIENILKQNSKIIFKQTKIHQKTAIIKSL